MCGGLYLLSILIFATFISLCLCLWAGIAELQRGRAILGWAGLLSLLARLNSTSMNIQIGAERPGRGQRGAG